MANAALVTLLLFITARPKLNATATAFESAEAVNLKQAQREVGRNSFTFLCSDRRDDYIETGARFVELQLDLALSQTGLLNQAKETLQGSSAIAFDQFCADLANAAGSQTAPDRLALYQDLAASSAEVFQQVRPAFNRFYQSLSAQQQQELDQMLNAGSQ
ncbi:MAG: hypothetical protein HC886_14855 [Leptolyngbyaceae cyanobacterium SM1_1_3]|nr:hypothetical protein [Leptolyngbyaceae cyanobacterium SM1_1_3]NJM85763.1 hypothetical protein [Leptolyngbyaceae cyanobacterium RM2_2_21]NJN03767.1 hypothetical protein [Leptolyngbyaceae cyanobacterium RM1_1_2]